MPLRIIILFLTFFSNIIAEEISGVPKIVDGDTIHINDKKFVNSFSFLFLISIILELLHFFIPNRAFELNDLYANSLGVLMAYFIFKFSKKLKN